MCRCSAAHSSSVRMHPASRTFLTRSGFSVTSLIQKGGFQTAVALRGGVSQLRSLHARRKPNVSVEVSLDLNGAGEEWIYRLEFSQDNQLYAESEP